MPIVLETEEERGEGSGSTLKDTEGIGGLLRDLMDGQGGGCAGGA